MGGFEWWNRRYAARQISSTSTEPSNNFRIRIGPSSCPEIEKREGSFYITARIVPDVCPGKYPRVCRKRCGQKFCYNPARLRNFTAGSILTSERRIFTGGLRTSHWRPVIFTRGPGFSLAARGVHLRPLLAPLIGSVCLCHLLP